MPTRSLSPDVSAAIRIPRPKKAAQLLLCAVTHLLRKRRTAAGVAKRVVVMEPFGMGDVITLRPLLQGLIDRGFQVVLVAQERWSPLLDDLPELEWIPSRFSWSAGTAGAKYSPLSLLRSHPIRRIRELRRRVHGFMAIDPRGDARSVFVLTAAGCHPVWTLDAYIGTDARLPSWMPHKIPTDFHQPRWKLALRFLEALGLPSAEGTAPSFPRPVDRKNLSPNACVGLLPVAPWAGKEWPDERWQSLREQLQLLGYSVLGLAGPGQTERVRRILPDVPIVLNATMEDWRTNLCSLRALVTVDSGPMHVADALGVPLVALFGATCSRLWGPSAATSRILHPAAARQNFRPLHPIPRNAEAGRNCMCDIQTEQVVAVVRSLLEDKNARTEGAVVS